MATSSSGTRYRCEACGNLTRFEVTATRTTRAFHHYTVGGELSVEDLEVVSEQLDSVICRWCGTGSNVVEIDADEIEESDDLDNSSRASGGVG
ncbi:MAG: hypothetical protein KDB26_07450 [Microthrixaceae bacterium]|nr:hypothetical protein [Microthrixaceae bacterium]